MIFKILIRYILGYVNISVEGYYIERFINICIGSGVFLWNVKIKKATNAYANVGLKDFKKLREIAIPDGVKELGGFLFQESSNLEKISIPKSIEKMDNATFFAVSSIEEINLDVENSNFIYENGILLSKDRTKMYTVTKQATNSQTFSIPNGITTLCEGVLNGFSHITKIIIPESVSEIKADFFPFDIEEIEIDTNNQSYISINQQICTKDKKVLCFCYSKNQVIILEEGIEEIVNGALEKCNNAIQVNFPSTLKVLSNQALKGMNNVRNICRNNNRRKL